MLVSQEQQQLVVEEVRHLLEVMLLEAQVEQVEQEHQITLLGLSSFTLVVEEEEEQSLEELAVLV
jgi:hypothetical protein